MISKSKAQPNTFPHHYLSHMNIVLIIKIKISFLLIDCINLPPPLPTQPGNHHHNDVDLFEPKNFAKF